MKFHRCNYYSIHTVLSFRWYKLSVTHYINFRNKKQIEPSILLPIYLIFKLVFIKFVYLILLRSVNSKAKYQTLVRIDSYFRSFSIMIKYNCYKNNV